MMVEDCFAREKLTRVLGKVCERSIADHYNPYVLFKWPEAVASDSFWMSPELMSIHGTSAAKSLTEAQLIELSKWESINFYSLNIHGIRELLITVMERIHTESFALPSEFFHHFIEEENSHLWFFAQFCLRYGGKIYPERRMPGAGDVDQHTQQYLIFAKIMIFEEIVDYFNRVMATDNRLDGIVRELNRVHHHDESRHIACTRELTSALYELLRDRVSSEVLAGVEKYLKQYMVVCVESLYNPSVYLDAKLPLNAYQLRRELLADPARKEFHREILKRTVGFFHSHGMFASETVAA